MELGGVGHLPNMEQDPKVTLNWALRGLERALRDLPDGLAEQRVRRQFHQVLLAVERADHFVGDETPQPPRAEGEKRADPQRPDKPAPRTPKQRAGA